MILKIKSIKYTLVEKILIKWEVIEIPEISRFYGIIIKMFFKPKEHEPSHIHAIYGEYVGIFNLQTIEMIEGDLPKRAQEMVKEWLTIYQKELLNM